MSILPIEPEPQDTRLSDALGRQYDRITEFLNRNANPQPTLRDVGRAALSSAYGGADYQQSISQMMADRRQSEAQNIGMQGDALNLLVKRNELLASQGHPAAAALQDALKTIGFSGWDPQQQQALLKGIHDDPEQMNETNALEMVMRHSQAIDFTPEPDLPSGYEMGPEGPQLAPWYLAGEQAKAEATRSPGQPVQPNYINMISPEGRTQVVNENDVGAMESLIAQGYSLGNTGTGGMPYVSQGSVRLPTGEVTVGRFDKSRGEYEILTTDGEGNEVWVPAPRGSAMVTESSVSDTHPTANQFYKIQQDVVTDRNSLLNLNRFMSTVNDVRTGYNQLADQFIGVLKTITGEQNLTKEQLSALALNGQLQTLLGQNRLAIVGGGVMTEYDAQRVVGAILGSAPGGIINPELVAQNLQFLFEQKKNNYSAAVQTYNNMIAGGQSRGDSLYTGLQPLDPDEIQFNSSAVPEWAQ